MQTGRKVWQTLDQVLTKHKLIFLDKIIQVLETLRILLRVIYHNKPLHESLLDDKSHIILDSVLRSSLVILTDSTAEYDPGTLSDIHQNIIQYFSAHVVEVDVHSLRAEFPEFFPDTFAVVVDAGISPQSV